MRAGASDSSGKSVDSATRPEPLKTLIRVYLVKRPRPAPQNGRGTKRVMQNKVGAREASPPLPLPMAYAAKGQRALFRKAFGMQCQAAFFLLILGLS